MNDTFTFMAVLTAIVGFIGLGTLLAGIIGISNIMVYIVKEKNQRNRSTKSYWGKTKWNRRTDCSGKRCDYSGIRTCRSRNRSFDIKPYW